MKYISPQDSTYWLLVHVSLRARHDFSRIAEKKYGLTCLQLYTFCLLDPSAPAAMNSISCQLLCDASNVTGIVDRLVAQGYIARQDDPNDRRVKVIVLTKKGIALREQIMADIAQMEPQEMSGLSAAERKQMRQLLEKVIRSRID